VELSKGVGPWLRSLIMPAAALAWPNLGSWPDHQGTMLEVLRQDYVRTARAKGAPDDM